MDMVLWAIGETIKHILIVSGAKATSDVVSGTLKGGSVM